MANLNGFDASTVEPAGDFSPIPEGIYTCGVVESSMEPNKAGTGSYLKMKIEVLEGEEKGRSVFEFLNLDHPNEKAVNIAKATLSSICRATGVMQPKDSMDLHDIPFDCKIVVTKGKDKEGNDRMNNNIKKYATQGSLSAGDSAPATGKEKAPWAK